MNSRQRIEAALTGSQVDRVPLGFWRHFHEIDRDPEQLAAASVRFWDRFRPDFLKTMPNGCFFIEDWPCEIDFSHEPAKVVSPAIREPGDWMRLRPLSPEEGSLAREIRATRVLREHLPPEVPIVATVFNPLSIADKLSGGLWADHMRSDPSSFRKGLTTITATVRDFIARLIAEGVDGVFFAVQTAVSTLMTETEYREFGCPYDLETLEAASRAWFNVLHIHGTDIMFTLLSDYPAQAVNWQVWDTPPSLGEAMRVTDKALVGGLDRWAVHRGSQSEIEREVKASISETGGRRLILAPGCVLRLGYSESNVDVVRRLAGASD